MKKFVKILAIVGCLFITALVVKINIMASEYIEQFGLKRTYSLVTNSLADYMGPIALSMIPVLLIGCILMQKRDLSLLLVFWAFSLLVVPFGVYFTTFNSLGLYVSSNTTLFIIILTATAISKNERKSVIATS